MKVKVPPKVKVASHSYLIRFDRKVLRSASANGLARHTYQDIIVSDDVAMSERNQILLHELLHLVERFWGVKLDDIDIDRIAEGLAVILFDNLGIELDWSLIEGSK